jgi:hypothetical protein
VVAGFATTVVLSLGTEAVMHATGLFPPRGAPMSNGLYAWATVYRIAFTVTGGYLTARLASRRPMRHVVALGVVGLVAAAAGAAATWNAGPAFGPRWYPLALIGTALPSVWAGGILQARLKD